MAYRAPIAKLSALSKDTMPEGPIFGVATAAFPPAFARFVSAMFAQRSVLRSMLSVFQGSIGTVHFNLAARQQRRAKIGPVRNDKKRKGSRETNTSV